MKTVQWFGLFVWALWCGGVATADETGLIATGWDSPTPARFRAELADFEKWNAFDGTTIFPTRQTSDGQTHPAHNAFSHEHWEWSEFAQCIADLRAAKPQRATRNFLILYANPGDVDWFDDAGWREVVDHWRLLARVCRESGMIGILYDAEPYTPPHSQFLYRAQPAQEQHSFAEYQAQARQRGREVMQAVAEEHPALTIMTYRLFCDVLPVLDSGDPSAALEPSIYGLQPAFVDGWCDVMPPELRVIEGDEDAYRFNSESDFDRAYTRLRTKLPAFVSPENREKLRNQTRVGHGIYLDAHVNPPESPWYIDRLGGTSDERLAANVSAALAAADGFVWIYGEQGRWWPGGDAKFPVWPEKLAGADRALQLARDPLAPARAALAEAASDANRAVNSNFEMTTPEGLPQDWWTWQDDASHGQFRCDAQAACLTGMLNGTFGQNITVKPDERYAVRVRVRTENAGYASLGIGWKTPEGRWLWGPHRSFGAGGPADAQGWREALAGVRVPPEAGFMVIMLAASGQSHDTDRAWFDDLQVVQVQSE